MAVGILGTKLGMTQIFDQETGLAIPVTVVQAGPCTVTQIKTSETDGYSAIQVGYNEVKEKALTKAELGHLKKNDVPPLRHLKEYRLENPNQYQLGDAIKADIFKTGDLVDIAGKSIGRGFAGYQKRHNFKRGNMTHGSKNHRLPGSTGAGTTPGRVYPGKRMAGQYGATQVTIRKLQVVQVYGERNLILVKGAIPGKSGALLNITLAKKVGK
ncbi:MAG: 50S ribosomal protein L3 [cyanobacterium endosymbiont of Rhopalodia musculus]|uniref:50S ribosomal protein L3 n=1 Tax=cyanobacterium endosymbiont of Epithemia clementina EcSB TaxID=3034674 RepID=UPI002480FE70|nr:50S ribosomal protein L3 [cyanobacterium endosymbiont of Epithemia clementina EcSB]WGT67950.1 50S ribosomal protein L3 [cyanobacterium endosymbiont of Epithemia clementina EcSB]